MGANPCPNVLHFSSSFAIIIPIRHTANDDPKYLLMQEMNMRLSSISGLQIEQIDKYREEKTKTT
mgnify:CR=1 FL=1